MRPPDLFYGNPVTCSVPLEGRGELKQSQEIKLTACSRFDGTPTKFGGGFGP